MKRVFQHPTRDAQPKLWRTSGERENAAAFNEVLGREFPAGVDRREGEENMATNGMSRRNFLKLTGASAALAGIGLTACRRPEAYLVPFTRSAEWTIPGKFLYYATTMPTPLGGIPLIATTSDGRPTKLEGNPLHPLSNGSTDAFAQASILDLYDPHRAKEIKRDGKKVKRAALDAYLAGLRQIALSNQGEGLVFVVESAHSPTRNRLRDALMKEFPKMKWFEYEPLSHENEHQACEVAFGVGMRPLYHLKKADVLVALDSDFLNPIERGVGFASDFYTRRNPDQAMNRLYAVENHYTLTGGMADHRLRVKASQIGAFAATLALQIAKKTNNGSLESLASTYLTNHSAAALPDWGAWIKPLADDLMAAQGKSLVLTGPGQSEAVQLLVFGINTALGNLGSTIDVAALGKKPTSFEEVVAALKANSIKQLFLFQTNLLYTAPQGAELAKLLAAVPDSFHLSLNEDETSKACHWVVPAAHYLESWGDTRSFEGTLCAIQPMVLPLWNGLTEIEILNALQGKPAPEGPALIRETFNVFSKDTSDAAWNQYLHNGFLENSAAPVLQSSWNEAAVQSAVAAEVLEPVPQGEFELVFLPSSSTYDGRYSGNAWLQETPDFVTKLTWDNALLMSPADAKRFGLTDGDMVALHDGTHTVNIAVLEAPGHADGSVSAALGYGREGLSHVINHVGFNVYPLRKNANLDYVQGISIKPLAGKKYVFAQTQEHHNMEGRDLVREGTVKRYEEDPKFAQTMGMDSHIPPNIGLYTRPPFTAPEQWGMSIDLNTCIGCNACLLACQAENNVPVVGKEQVRRGRDMAWIRIDRWFASIDGSEDNPEMLPQAIMCQQCDNAPCETVCPVNATVHSEDGLNLMAYNRCIGTRYCANNCPWKVRRFNFFDYNQRPLDELYYGPLAPKGMADSLKMSKNPNVTVRMRGVMEKCTFCLQRIEEAKIGRLVKAGASDAHKTPIAPFKTACQQACPSESIVFGNIADPNAQVSKLKQSPRDYTMLKYLNTKPRVTYLARIKNPNAAMPGAERVGLANGVLHHHGEHQSSDKEHHDIGSTHFDNHGVAAPATSSSAS
ncbi:MAG: TAT-variant-translocated molybdopterin oxidoreductase [Chthoniobacterales bacterium]|nr:TAT-variant-translocated molybdopterin oxidoreductase [Chthoniobacterales bacterium]